MDTKLTNLKDNLEPLFEQFKEMIRVETVVGEAVQLGDTTIVPFVDVSLGLGGCQKAGGGGAKVEPTAVLVIKGERIELFSIKNATANNTIDKMLNLMPEIISHFRKGKKDKNLLEEQVKTDADIDIKE